MGPKLLALAVAALALLALLPPARVSGQPLTSSCTASLVNTFTPCLSYITNSTKGGVSSWPTTDCCRCLAGVVSASTSCACLILTGKVPLGLPINHTLALTLPKACNSTSVPLFQCEDTLAAGPVAVSPAMFPLPPMAPESLGQTTRPQVVPGSAWKAGVGVSVLLAVVGAMMLA